jgi:hypothetical protein
MMRYFGAKSERQSNGSGAPILEDLGGGAR